MCQVGFVGILEYWTTTVDEFLYDNLKIEKVDIIIFGLYLFFSKTVLF